MITVDKRCLSCSDQPGKVLSIVKMACLSYFPSKIEYLGNSLTRIELLEVQKGLMQLL